MCEFLQDLNNKIDDAQHRFVKKRDKTSVIKAKHERKLAEINKKKYEATMLLSRIVCEHDILVQKIIGIEDKLFQIQRETELESKINPLNTDD